MFDIIFPALLSGILLSFITAPLGAFVVWRKMSYFGDTLSHSALLGVALGIWLHINPYLSILLLTLILAVMIVWLEERAHFSIDTLLGIIAHSSLSLGIVVVGLLHNIRVFIRRFNFHHLSGFRLYRRWSGYYFIFSDSLLASFAFHRGFSRTGTGRRGKYAENALFADDFDRTNHCIKYEICRRINYHFVIDYSFRNGATFCQNPGSHGIHRCRGQYVVDCRRIDVIDIL